MCGGADNQGVERFFATPTGKRSENSARVAHTFIFIIAHAFLALNPLLSFAHAFPFTRHEMITTRARGHRDLPPSRRRLGSREPHPFRSLVMRAPAPPARAARLRPSRRHARDRFRPAKVAKAARPRRAYTVPVLSPGAVVPDLPPGLAARERCGAACASFRARTRQHRPRPPGYRRRILVA